MLPVSCRVTQNLVVFARNRSICDMLLEQGMPAEPGGVVPTLQDLCNENRWTGWEQLDHLVNRMTEAFHGEEWIASFAETCKFAPDDQHPRWRLLGFLVPTKAIYSFGVRWAKRRLFKGLEAKVFLRENRCLVLDVDPLGPHLVPPVIYTAMAINLERWPSLFGLFQSKVSFKTANGHAVFRIKLPPPIDILARLKKAFLILFGSRTHMVSLVEDSNELRERIEFLATSELRLRETVVELQRRISETAKSADRAKTTFLANISHEIRTPMTAILGFAQLLSDARLDLERRQDYIERILRNGRLIMDLFENLLEASLIESGRLQLQFSDVSIEKCVESLRRKYLDEARAKNLNLSFDIAPDVPKHIRSDAERLRQALGQVISNSIKFTDRGTITLTVTTVSDQPDVVSFLVKDTGCGIDTKTMDQLYEIFGQGDSSSTRRYDGVGLGLYVARHLSIALGGKLELLESSPGRGSSFLLTLRDAPPSDVPTFQV